MKAERYTKISTVGLVVFCLMNIMLFHQTIHAQESKKSNPNKPDIRVKVNKEFDDKGNLTRYDSTYSYSWSGGGQIPFSADSTFGNSKSYLRNGSDSTEFQPFFFNDNRLNEILRFYSEQGLSNKSDSLESSRFKEFFKHNQGLTDPFLKDDPFDSFEKEFEDMMKQKQNIMDQFFNQAPNQFRPEIKKSQKDSIQMAPIQKQKNKLNKQTKTGTVWI